MVRVFKAFGSWPGRFKSAGLVSKAAVSSRPVDKQGRLHPCGRGDEMNGFPGCLPRVRNVYSFVHPSFNGQGKNFLGIEQGFFHAFAVGYRFVKVQETDEVALLFVLGDL